MMENMIKIKDLVTMTKFGNTEHLSFIASCHTVMNTPLKLNTWHLYGAINSSLSFIVDLNEDICCIHL